MNELLASAIFTLVVLGLLALDLGVMQRRPHVISIREAALWSAFWIALSLGFNLALFFWHGSEPALQFLAGYIIEKSLSMDNVFVFAMIFSYAAVPALHQHKVLFWGILGALVTRGIFIAAGVALIARFHWILYLFGVFLVITAVRLMIEKDKQLHPERNPLLRLARRIFPFTENYEGSRFFVRRGARLYATPLLLVLVMIETMDVIFALDSIPAVFAVTNDPFIVYTSNICAVLGLRALYFVLAGAMLRFRYLRPGLALILTFVGVKMLVADVFKIPTPVSLAVICVILIVTIAISWRVERREHLRAGATRT